MACGTPVITSNTSAIPEIAGKDCILVNPMKPEEISEKLLELENNSEFYQQQVDYGLQRIQNFSWKKTAEALLNIYKEI